MSAMSAGLPLEASHPRSPMASMARWPSTADAFAASTDARCIASSRSGPGSRRNAAPKASEADASSSANRRAASRSECARAWTSASSPRWCSSGSVYPATIDVNDAATASISPAPAPPPGEPVDSAKARVQSSTVECRVVTASESAMTPSVPPGCPAARSGGHSGGPASPRSGPLWCRTCVRRLVRARALRGRDPWFRWRRRW